MVWLPLGGSLSEWWVGSSLQLLSACCNTPKAAGPPILSVAPIAMFTKHSGHKGHGDKPLSDISQVPQVQAQVADPTIVVWW